VLPPHDDDPGTLASHRMRKADVLIVILQSAKTPGFHYLPLEGLSTRRTDFLPSFEGIPPTHGFARRLFSMGGKRFQLWIQFGERRVSKLAIRRANSVLASFRAT
jgi:hypothetical protein